MKKTFILMAFAVAFLAVSCSRDKGKELLTKEITYDVNINNSKIICDEGNEGAYYTWFYNNMEASVRCGFLDDLFERAIKDTANTKDTLKIKDDDGNMILAANYKQKLIVYDSVRSHYPYLVCDTLIASKIKPSDITVLRFREKWTYNPKTLEITKTVLGYAPLYFPNDPARPGKRVHVAVPLFWKHQDNTAECNVMLTKKIMYNVPVSHLPEVLNQDSASCAKYLGILTQRVFNDSITAYLWDWTKTDSIVVGEAWKAMFGIKDEGKASKEIAKIQKCFEPVDCFRFTEEWYINPVTMALGKKVTRLCGVSLKYNKKEIKDYYPTYVVRFDVPQSKIKVKKVEEKTEKTEEATK